MTDVSGLMKGKKGLVVGIANDRSYATFITQCLLGAGAQCMFTHLPGEKMERRCRNALTELGVTDPWLMPMDASSDADLDTVFGKLKEDFRTIDFVVHSIAFADKNWLEPGKFTATPREVFVQAMDISAFTYQAMGHRAAELMPTGGALIALSYYGAEKAIPGYNVMGVAKAALEATNRYMAMELGAKQIRCNVISGGPLKTLSAMAVGGLTDILGWVEQKAPLRRNITGTEIGDAAVFLASSRAAYVTGHSLVVDGGFHL